MRIPVLDRYVLRFFWSSYALCFAVLTLLFVLADLFDKLPRLLASEDAWWRALPRYYAGQLPVIFDRFAPFITLAGAMFAVARLERNNEVLPMKAGGVSVFRAMAPVLLSAAALGGVGAANKELVIPPLADLVRASMSFQRTSEVHPGILRDAAGGTLYAERYDPAARRLEGVSYRSFDARGRETVALFAARATWVARTRTRGHWLLEDGVACDYASAAPPIENGGGVPRVSQRPIGTGADGRRLDTSIRPIDIESLGERESLLSFKDLRDQYRRQQYLPQLRVQLHARIAAPLTHLILPLIGLPFVLRGGGRRGVFLGLLALIVICAGYFVTSFVFLDLGADGYLRPIVAAWAPTVAFGVLGIVMFDRVCT